MHLIGYLLRLCRQHEAVTCKEQRNGVALKERESQGQRKERSPLIVSRPVICDYVFVSLKNSTRQLYGFVNSAAFIGFNIEWIYYLLRVHCFEIIIETD